jgi:TP901 family phage tail tape measure protein
MAGRKVGEVFVEVRANLSKLKAGMKSAMSIAGGGASVIGRILGGLASLIKNVLTAAFKVVGAVIKTIFKLVTSLFSSIIKWAKRGVLALSAFAALSVVVGAKFGQSMSRVKALTGASAKEFKALREEARRLGRATEFSANEAADAMSIFAMAGFKTNDVITAMTPTLDFAAASGLDLASAADIAARVMGGMQLEAKDLEHTMDVLTKAFTSANMDATDLGEAMKFVGAVGKTVGKDVEEIVGSLTALAAAGNRGSMAGTGLRKVLMGLATGKVQRKLEKLGVSVTDASGAMKPMSELIGDLTGATKHLSDMEIADLGVQMFGARGGVAFLQLIGQGEEAIRKYTEQLANVDGFTRDIAATQRDTLATAFKIVQSAIADVMISVTDVLEPALLKATESQVNMWNRVGEVLEENKEKIQDFIEDTIILIKEKLPKAINIGVGSVAELWDQFKSTFDSIKELVGGTATAVGESLGNFFEFDAQTGTMIERVVGAFLMGMLKIKQTIVDIFERMKMGMVEMELIKEAGTAKSKMALIEWLHPKRKEGDVIEMRSPFDPRAFIAAMLGRGATEEEVLSTEESLRHFRENLGFEADLRNEAELIALRETIKKAFEKEGDAVVAAVEKVAQTTEQRGAGITQGWRDAVVDALGLTDTTNARRMSRLEEIEEFQTILLDKFSKTQDDAMKLFGGSGFTYTVSRPEDLKERERIVGKRVEIRKERQGILDALSLAEVAHIIKRLEEKREVAGIGREQLMRLNDLIAEYTSILSSLEKQKMEAAKPPDRYEQHAFMQGVIEKMFPFRKRISTLEDRPEAPRKIKPMDIPQFSGQIQTVIGVMQMGLDERTLYARQTAKHTRDTVVGVDDLSKNLSNQLKG